MAESPLAVALGRRHPVYWATAAAAAEANTSRPPSLADTIIHLPYPETILPSTTSSKQNISDANQQRILRYQQKAKVDDNDECRSHPLSLLLLSESSPHHCKAPMLFRQCEASSSVVEDNDDDEPKYLRKALADNDKKCFSKSCPRVIRNKHLPTTTTTTASTIRVLSEILEEG